jgi:flagellar protein FliO/FliZ
VWLAAVWLAAAACMPGTGTLAAQAVPDAQTAPAGEAGILLDAPAVFPAPEGGGEGSVALDSSPRRPFGAVFALLRLVLVLALVAAAVYGGVYYMTRSKKNAIRENPHLKVLASAPVNARCSVAVVAVGKSAFLVGAAENAVSLIAPLSDQETVDAMMLAHADETVAAAPDFRTLLRRFGVRLPAAPPRPAGEGPSAEARDAGARDAGPALRSQRERLRGL